MNGEYTGIPTLYAGVQMRSRLEAKWAAFFDQMGWSWRYEPVEFKGWIPDFVLLGKQEIVYVEVKPIAQRFAAVCEKIDRSECGEEVLLLGLAPLLLPKLYQEETDTLCLGWLREQWGDEGDVIHWSWGDAHFWSQNLQHIGFHAESGSWHDRISGGYDGDSGCQAGGYEHVRTVVNAHWAAACNATQWKKTESGAEAYRRIFGLPQQKPSLIDLARSALRDPTVKP